MILIKDRKVDSCERNVFWFSVNCKTVFCYTFYPYGIVMVRVFFNVFNVPIIVHKNHL